MARVELTLLTFQTIAKKRHINRKTPKDCSFGGFL